MTCRADHQAHGWPPTPDLSKMMRIADHQPLTTATWCAGLTTNPWPQEDDAHSWPPTLDHSNVVCRADHQAHGWPPTPDLSKMMRIADHQPLTTATWCAGLTTNPWPQEDDAHSWPPTLDHSNVVCRADRQPLTAARWCAGLTTNPWPQQDDVHGWAARWCTWLTTNPWPQQDDAHGWPPWSQQDDPDLSKMMRMADHQPLTSARLCAWLTTNHQPLTSARWCAWAARWCAWLTTNHWPQQDDAHGWPPTPDLSKMMCMPLTSARWCAGLTANPDLSKMMRMADHQPLTSARWCMADHQPLTSARWCAWLTTKMMCTADQQPLTSARWCAWLTTNPDLSKMMRMAGRESIIFMDFCANTLLHEAWPHLINQSLWNLSAFGIHSSRSSWSCWVVWKPYSSKHESYALGRNLSSRSCLVLGTSRAVSCQKNNVAAGHGEGKLKSRIPRTSSSRISACSARTEGGLPEKISTNCGNFAQVE